MYRTMLSSLILFGIGAGGYLFYAYTQQSLVNESEIITEQGSNTNTVEDVLVEENQKEELQEQKKEIKIIIAGDAMFEADLASRINAGYDPFMNMSEFWNEHDIKMLNLETNISNPNNPKAQKNYTFNAPLKTVDALANGEVDIVSLANNHTMDYLEKGLLEQIELLEKAGITTVGAGKNYEEAFSPKYFELNDYKIAFLAFNTIETGVSAVRPNRAGSAYFDEGRIKQSISIAKQNSDLVIVMPHWGVEHMTTPTSSQTEWAKKFSDYGADFVVGAHPHVVQKSEWIGKTYVHYSLGNFMFVGMWGRPLAMQGEMLQIIIQSKEVKDINKIEYRLTDWGMPIIK